MHPIIFSAQSVQAILDNRKTQTRRVIRGTGLSVIDRWVESRLSNAWYGYHGQTLCAYFKCPYGYPGDRLWVKETWIELIDQEAGHNLIAYKADGDNIKVGYDINSIKWHSPRFMPKWASRITLEITGIRAERLRDITIEDATAEGFYCGNQSYADVYPFIEAWDSLNARHGYPWIDNPWVWVIEFKRL